MMNDECVGMSLFTARVIVIDYNSSHQSFNEAVNM